MIIMQCSAHEVTYLRHEGCPICDYTCGHCDLEFMTVDDLSKHVEDNHKGRVIISADKVVKY